MATEALCRHEAVSLSPCGFLSSLERPISGLDGSHRHSMPAGEMQVFMPMTVAPSASRLSSSSSIRRDGVERWLPCQDRLKASELKPYVRCRRTGAPSSQSSSAFSVFKVQEGYGILRTEENRQSSSSRVRNGSTISGCFRSSSSPSSSPSPSPSPSPSSSSSPSPSPSPSPSMASSSASPSSSDADGAASPEFAATSKRSRPLFVLSDKPDRSKQVHRKAPERQRPERFFENSSEEDLGLPLINNNPNHRSGYVALIGKPNVGKSTLMNCIIGQKLSIVTHKPQTTRHRILGICSAPEYQMILYDTPGMITKRMNKLDELMMQNVRTAALNADCVLVIVDASEEPQRFTDNLEEGAMKVVQKRPSLLVMNKRDKIKPGEVASRLKLYEECRGLKESMAISAKFGHGVEELKNWLVSKLPLGPAYYPKEDVNVVTYIRRTPPAKDFIEVEIVVERETQKAILIGKEGAALKTLATASRLDIEDFVGRDVYIEVKVKVKEDWRANEGLLRHYGYSGQGKV